MPEIRLKLVVDGKEANATLDLTDSNIKDLRSSLGAVERESGKTFDGLGMKVISFNQGLELAKKALSFLSQPIDAASQFEGYETSLKVMLGSTEAAKARLQELTQFAASTPFEIPDVVTLGNQLQAIGQYSIQTMTDLGDLAAASGKPIDQVTGAFAKLATGQKGVAVDMFRDLLISTKDWEKAVGKSIDKITSDEMMGQLPQIMKDKGFAGMMDEQSKTFAGQMSNFQDIIGGVMRDIGMMILPLAKSILGTLGPAIGFLKDNLSWIIPILGTLTLAVGAYVAVSKIAAVVTAIKTFGLAAYSLATNMSTVAIVIATAKQWLWNAAIVANPIGLLIAGVVALVGAVVLLTDVFSESAEERLEDAKATEEMVKQQKTSVETQIQEREEVVKLIEEYEKLLNKKNRTAEETAKLDTLYNQINSKYPGLVKSQDNFTAALDSAKTGAAQLNGEIGTLIIEYDSLSAAALEASKNVNIAQRDVAADILDKTFKNTLEGVWTEADAIIDDKMFKEYEILKNKIYYAKTLNEVNDANYAFQNEMSALQKKYKDELTAQEILDLNAAAQKVADTQKKILEDRIKVVESFADKQARLEKEAKDKAKLEAEKNKNSGKDKKTGATESDIFKEKEKELIALQKFESDKLKLSKATSLELLENEKSNLEKLDQFYAEYAVKDVELKKSIADKKLEIDRELQKNELAIANETAKAEADFMKNAHAEYEKVAQEQLEIRQSELEELRRIERLKIDNIDNEYQRQLALAEYEYNLAVEKSGNLVSLEMEYANKIQEIERIKEESQRQATMSALSTIAQAWGEHTVMYKAFAIAQTTMAGIQSAQEAFKSAATIPGIGFILAPIAAASAAVFAAKQITEIMGVQVPGFAQGGMLPKGKAGIIEGFHNEIIAPERTFVDVMNRNIMPALNVNNESSGLGEKLDKVFSGIKDWATSLTVVNRLDNLDYENTRYNNIKLRYSY